MQVVGRSFLYSNKSLKQLIVPKLEKVGDDFLHNNEKLENIECPNLQKVGYEFLYKNESLKQFIVSKFNKCCEKHLSDYIKNLLHSNKQKV